MPTLLIAMLGVLMVALYALLVVSMIRRQLGLPRQVRPFPRVEDLVSVGASEQIASLLAEGRKIEAIRAYRHEMNRPGLFEAKAAVDTFLVHARARLFISAGAAEQVAHFLAEDNRIAAIKAFKEENGVTLQEAKGAVDAMLARYS